MVDPLGVPDFGLGWLDAGGPHADVVLSTRVRLARNLQGQPFAVRARDGDRERVLERMRQAAARSASLRGGGRRSSCGRCPGWRGRCSSSGT